MKIIKYKLKLETQNSNNANALLCSRSFWRWIFNIRVLIYNTKFYFKVLRCKHDYKVRETGVFGCEKCRHLYVDYKSYWELSGCSAKKNGA